MTTYLFIGGPADGKTYDLSPSIGTEYHFAYSPPFAFSASSMPLPMGYMNVGRAVYMRHKIGVDHVNRPSAATYTVYVFSHIDGLVANDLNAKIMFESRIWRIKDIRWNNGETSVRAVAQDNHQAVLEGSLFDLAYQFELDAWTFKKRSVIYVNETRTVVVS